MKTWKIKLTAIDEKSAVDFLRILISNVKSPSDLKNDMDDCRIEDEKNGERLHCKLIGK